jgi:hypothetical protein
MNDLPPGPPRVIRKSAYGRTQLFLPSKNVILREVKCMGGITKHDKVNVYHLLPEIYKQNVVCWHCCEPIQKVEQCIPIPRFYDNSEGVYHVFGATCSPNCTKAYLIEHTTFDRGQSLNVLTRMLQDVYKIYSPVIETPPRPALTRFGGIFDPTNTPKTECTLVEPPFISYCMIAEERAVNVQSIIPSMTRTPQIEEADTFDEPQPPALFEKFMKEQEGDEDMTSHSSTNEAYTVPLPLKRRRGVKSTENAASTSTGPMAKFVKKP